MMNKGMYEKVLEDAVDFFTSGYEDGGPADKPKSMTVEVTAQGAGAPGDGDKDVPRMKDC